MKIQKILCVILMVGCSTFASEEKNDQIVSILSEKMSSVTNSRSGINVENLANELGVQALPALKIYRESDSYDIRWHAYAMTYSIANKLEVGSKERQELLEILLDHVSKNDERLSQHIREWIIKDFVTCDFSEGAKAKIHELLIRGTPKNADILLAGVANMKDELPLLQTIAENSLRNPSSIKMWCINGEYWAVLSARARIGVKEDVQRSIELVDAVTNMQQKIVLWNQLSYIRQPEVAEYFAKYLKRDDVIESSGCVSRILVADRAADALDKLVLNFPQGPWKSTEEKIETCRRWLEEKAEWDIVR